MLRVCISSISLLATLFGSEIGSRAANLSSLKSFGYSEASRNFVFNGCRTCAYADKHSQKYLLGFRVMVTISQRSICFHQSVMFTL